MKILSLKLKSKNNPNVFLFVTDNGEYELHSDAIVKYNICVGYIDEEKFYKCQQESCEIIAFNLAAKYVGSRLKTEHQIKDYLYKKNFHKSVVDFVVDKLKNYKIIFSVAPTALNLYEYYIRG